MVPALEVLFDLRGDLACESGIDTVQADVDQRAEGKELVTVYLLSLVAACDHQRHTQECQCDPRYGHRDLFSLRAMDSMSNPAISAPYCASSSRMQVGLVTLISVR